MHVYGRNVFSLATMSPNGEALPLGSVNKERRPCSSGTSSQQIPTKAVNYSFLRINPKINSSRRFLDPI
jgi:hypothetical protein